MPYYEIQVLVGDDSKSPMTRIDRCTLTAGNLSEAAAAYAALFTSDQARLRPAAQNVAASPPPDPLVPHEEEDTYLDGGDDGPWDESAWSLLPTGETMNPARPASATYYDQDQVAYIVTGISQNCEGVVRVLTSYGRLNGWTLGTIHAVRHDQSGRSLGRWKITGIRNYKTGFQVGKIPGRPLRQWVFK